MPISSNRKDLQKQTHRESTEVPGEVITAVEIQSSSTNPVFSEGATLEDAPHTTGDGGFPMLGVTKFLDDNLVDVDADGDYAIPNIDLRGRMRVSPGSSHLIDTFSSLTGWAAVNDDTTTLALNLDHVVGSNSISFNKVDGTANTAFALIEKTVTSFNVFNLSTGATFIQVLGKMTNVTDVLNVVVRLGTDSSNYNTWKIDASAATANQWASYRALISSSMGSTGNGWDATAVTYVAVGVEFGTETDTLSDIRFDALGLTSGQLNSSDTTSEISTQLDSEKINLFKVKNKPVDTQAGDVGQGTQRVTIATDDVNLAALNAGQMVPVHSDQITPTVSTSTHFPGDFVALVELTNFYKTAGGEGNINSIVANDDLEQISGLEFRFYESEPTIASSQTDPFDLTDANNDLEIAQAIIPQGMRGISVSNFTMYRGSMKLGVFNSEDTRSVWCAILCTAAWTWTGTTPFKIRIFGEST